MADDVIVFANVGEAIAWSEERLLRPHSPTNTLGSLMAKQSVGRFRAADLQDFAHTVSLVVANVNPGHYGGLLRCIYGMPAGVQFAVAMELAAAAGRELPGDTANLSLDRLRNLAYALVSARRRLVLKLKTTPARVLAESIGLTKRHFFRAGWMPVVGTCNGLLDQWMTIGEAQVFDALDQKGMMA